MILNFFINLSIVLNISHLIQQVTAYTFKTNIGNINLGFIILR